VQELNIHPGLNTRNAVFPAVIRGRPWMLETSVIDCMI
jgi:hypothetical protein